MGKPFKKIDSGDYTVWITQPNEVESLLKRRETAFNVAKGKLADSSGNIETVMVFAPMMAPPIEPDRMFAVILSVAPRVLNRLSKSRLFAAL